MIHKKCFFNYIIVFVMLILVSACTPPDTGLSRNPTLAQQEAASAFEELNAYVNEVLLGSVAVNEMQESVFNGIRAKFQSSLSHDPDNGLANFGMGYLAYTRMMFSTTIRDYTIIANTMITEADGYMPPLGLPSQFTGLFNEFMLHIHIQPFTSAQLPTGSVNYFKISEIQDALDSEVIAPLKEAIAYFDKAAANLGDNGSVTYSIPGEPNEFIEIDKADVLFQKALTAIALAGFQTLTTYNLALEDPAAPGTELTLDVPTLQDSQKMFDTFKHNLNREASVPDFLKFLDYRPGRNLAEIRTSFITACTSISGGMTSLLAETDDQGDDVIPKHNVEIPPEALTQINTMLSNAGITNPSTGNTDPINATGIPDIMNIFIDLLNGTREFKATAHVDGAPHDVPYKINLGNFFGNTNSARYFLPLFDTNFAYVPGSFLDRSFGGSILKQDNSFLEEQDFAIVYMFIFRSMFMIVPSGPTEPPEPPLPPI